MVYTLGQPFPRVPLSLRLPIEMPDVEQMANYVAWASLDASNPHETECELIGSYGVNIKYYGQANATKYNGGVQQNVGCNCFWENLCVTETGYLDEKMVNGTGDTSYELFSYSWEDNVHTYVEMGTPRHARGRFAFRVDSCELRISKDRRGFEGYLILKLDKA